MEDEKLNPENFDKYILNDKEKHYNLQKFLKLYQIIENIEIDLAYFDYNNEETKNKSVTIARKGISNLRKLIHKDKLHPDLFNNFEITESEKQRRRAKYDTFMEKIQETEKEIRKMQNGDDDDDVGDDSGSSWWSLENFLKLFKRKEKKIVKQIEYKKY